MDVVLSYVHQDAVELLPVKEIGQSVMRFLLLIKRMNLHTDIISYL